MILVTCYITTRFFSFWDQGPLAPKKEKKSYNIVNKTIGAVLTDDDVNVIFFPSRLGIILMPSSFKLGRLKIPIGRRKRRRRREGESTSIVHTATRKEGGDTQSPHSSIELPKQPKLVTTLYKSLLTARTDGRTTNGAGCSSAVCFSV